MSERAPHDTGVGDRVTVHFTDMAHGGDAVGRADGAGVAVFAWPGIQGETATVEITARRPKMLRGLVVDVEQPSPLRTEPPCPYFGPCGGCQWQHIKYEGQVAFKSEILRSQLVRLGGVGSLEPVLQPPIPSPLSYHYRNTSHFAIDPASRAIGYFTRDSHTVVPVDECPISNEGINRMIPRVNEILRNSPIDAQSPGFARGIMRVWHVTVRHSEATGQTVLILHSRSQGQAVPRPRGGRQGAYTPRRPDTGPSLEPDPQSGADIPLARREVRRYISLLGRTESGEAPLALTVVEVMEEGTINRLGATPAASALAVEAAADAMTGTLLQDISGPSQETSAPLGAWLEQVGGRNYWVAPEAFFQANTAAANELLAQVLANVPARLGLVVDAHAGVGTFGFALAGRAAEVVLVESSSAAVASGQWTARTSRLSNVEYLHGRAEQVIKRLPANRRLDLVLLDPPRTGCHPDLLTEIARREVPRVIYVSCDPSTLARDIKLMSPGYKLTATRVVDMFPQTFHVESVSVLERM